MTSSEVIIIGAGVTGLAAGIELQDDAIIFEREAVPGGLACSYNFNGYWFDKTVHFLMINDKSLMKRMLPMLQNHFKFSPLEVWVDCKGEPSVRYPIQLNLGGLKKETQLKCIIDFCNVYYNEEKTNGSYKEFLLQTFGKTMCELFFFPYNEKCWKYPLDQIVAPGQVWNIHRPTVEEVMDGILDPNKTRGKFNTQGYYPVPPRSADKRGIGLLAEIMALNVRNLKLQSTVVSINPERHSMLIKTNSSYDEYRYNEGCLSTIPIPTLIKLCVNAPKSLVRDVEQLEWVKMMSVALSIKGERPKNTGHYRYFADPEISFNKLVYTTMFDEHSAPEDGYGLLLEIKDVCDCEHELYVKVIRLLHKLGILKEKDKVIAEHMWEIDPAYVIFTKDTQRILDNCKEFLNLYGITSLGRYGSWEYSSMAENLRDGFEYGKLMKL